MHRSFSRARLPQVLATLVCLAVVSACGDGSGEELGKVDTRFRLLSPDDNIRIEAFPDPKVDGIVCYLSRAEVGGYGGAVGIAEDSSDASLDCRQVGPIRFHTPLESGERVFTQRRSLIFKSLRVLRFCDATHNAVVYLAYSERLIEGSPKNSVTAVPVTPWPGQEDAAARCRYAD